MARFPITVGSYASVELNQVAFPKTGMVVSQTPLADVFTKAAPCENGMWLSANKSAGVLAPIANVADPAVGIAYTAEKEYGYYDIGLASHCWVAGDYPRVGILGMGDTITTNCLQYDTTEFANFAALETALAAAATTPVYVVPVANSAVPKLTASKPQAGQVSVYGVVTKYYTVPNGDKGVKYQIVHI